METIAEIRDDNLGFDKQEVSEWLERNAARCILKREDEIALLKVGKYGYHKLPGGGIEDGEEAEEALKREVREEIGSEIKILGELGEIVEYKTQQNIRQNSICFIVKEESSGKPDYTEKELEEEYKVKWCSIGEAIEKLNKDNPTHYIAKFINNRDLKFLQEAESQM